MKASEPDCDVLYLDRVAVTHMRDAVVKNGSGDRSHRGAEQESETDEARHERTHAERDTPKIRFRRETKRHRLGSGGVSGRLPLSIPRRSRW